jgi:Leucine-rich repeat (LRR) protein
MSRLFLFLTLAFWAFQAAQGQGTYRSIEAASKEPDRVFTLKLVKARPDEKAWQSFRKFENLNKLYLEDVLLDTVPASMSALIRMTTFQSKGNPIAHFPDTLKSWKALSYLELVEPKLDTFPTFCDYWGKLREIGISKNRADRMVLPECIGHLHELKFLAITQSPLDTLPRTLTGLPELEKLILKGCGIERFPDEMQRMEDLEVLVLKNNGLRTIPRSIGSLRKLRYLSLKGNLLESLPQSIAGCTSLKKLDIRDNYFSAYQIDILKALLPDTKILHDPLEEKEAEGSP